MTLDTTAPIKPNESLGGIRLRTHIGELQNLIEEAWISQISHGETTRVFLGGPFEACYTIAEVVVVSADIRNGSVYKLSAINGYRGTLFDNVRIGTRVSDVLALPGATYDDCDQAIVFDNTPGVALSVSADDPCIEELQNLSVTAITVFAAEMLEPVGTGPEPSSFS
jgi:hypothetical protein